MKNPSRWASASADRFGHIDIGPSRAIGVRHDPGYQEAKLAVEEEGMIATKVPQLGDVAGDVRVEIDIRQEGDAGVIVSPQ